MLAWLSRPVACLPSERISEITFDNGKSLYACHTRVRASFDPWTHERLPEISRRLRSLERALGHFKVPVKRLGALSLKAEASGDELEMALARRAFWPGKKTDFEENLFLSAFLEQWVLGRELSLAPATAEAALWRELSRDLAGELSLKERDQWMKEWLARLSSEERPFTGAQSSWAFARQARLKAPLFGYHAGEENWFFNQLAIFERSPTDFTKKNLRHWSLPYSVQGEVQLPFTGARFSLNDFAPARVGKLLLVRCVFPELTELDFLGIEFEHLVIVQSCEEPSSDLIIQALRNTKEFAQYFPETSFVHIHWPSLRMVLAKTGVRTRTIAGLVEPQSIKRFTAVGFLKNLEKDETGVGYWHGALEPLLSFRF